MARDGVRRPGHGARHAGRARRRSRPSTPASAAAGRPTPEQLADLERPLRGHRRRLPLAERTAAQVDAAARRLEAPRARAATSWPSGPSTPSRPSRMRRRPWRAAGVDEVVGLVLTPHRPPWARGSTSTGPPRPLGRDARSSPVGAVVRRAGFVALLAARVQPAALAAVPRAGAAVIFTAHSLPERVRPSRRPLPRPARRVGPADRRGGRPRRLAGGLAERRAHPRAVARPRRARRGPAPGRRGSTEPSWSARSASWPTTSRCSTTSTSRRPPWPRQAGSASPAPPRSTTTPRSSPSWPT